MDIVKFVWFAALAICISLPLAGCDGSVDAKARILEINSSNIKRMRSAYSIYTTGNQRPPKNEKSFRAYFENTPTAQGSLKRIGVEMENFDDLFISERDNQPFVVRWNVRSDKDEALIFEADGVDGKRMVAFYKPRELEKEEYEGYLSGEQKP